MMTREEILRQTEIDREIFNALPRPMQDLLIYEMELARSQYAEEPADD